LWQKRDEGVDIGFELRRYERRALKPFSGEFGEPTLDLIAP